MSPKRLRWLWSTFGLDPSRGTLWIFRSYSLQKSGIRELHKKYNRYHLKYQGSKGLVSSSFFPKCIWAAARTSNYTDEALSPKRLRQLQKVFAISLRKSVPNIIIICDYLQRNVSLSISVELKKWKKSFTRIGVTIWNSIPHSVKTPNSSNFYLIFVKKLNHYSLDNEDNYLNVI